MTLLIILISLVVVFGAGIAGFVVWRLRRTTREQKNYERALKLVPLLIHLPPMSEDIEVGQRDSRDVIEENISRAQTIYNIVASTMQKSSYKTRL